MSTTNNALLGHLSHLRIPFTDNLTAGSAATQAGAPSVPTMASRFTLNAGNTGSAVLRDVISLDAPDVCWVINDTAFSMDIYPNANGTQTINGSGSPLTIASGGFGFFVRIRSTADWRAAAFT